MKFLLKYISLLNKLNIRIPYYFNKIDQYNSKSIIENNKKKVVAKFITIILNNQKIIN